MCGKLKWSNDWQWLRTNFSSFISLNLLTSLKVDDGKIHINKKCMATVCQYKCKLSAFNY